MRQGRLIVIEGLDGSGKSTLAAALAQRLEACSMSSSLGMLSQVRQVCDQLHGAGGLARQLYYTYAVALVSQYAAPFLERGQDVVLDRYVATTLAYARHDDPDAPRLDEVLYRLIPATVTFFLDADAPTRQGRLLTRDGQLSEQDQLSISLHPMLRRQYLELLPSLPTTGQLHILDASAPLEELLNQQLTLLSKTNHDALT